MTATPESPSKIDVTDFGFNHPGELHLAVAGMLKHFQRLGIQVLPNVSPDESLFKRLQISALHGDPSAPSATAGPSQTLSGETAGSSNLDRRSVHGSAAGSSSHQSGKPAAPSNMRIDRPQNSGSTTQASTGSAAKAPATTANRITVSPIAAGDNQRYSLPILSDDERQLELDAARQKVAGCRACPELVIGRKQTVYGEGSVSCRVCFFGEAPGAEEDQQGKPFVGKAGQLLTKMIQACTFKREECYILNTIKCRPPGNRTPSTQEVENCRGFFQHQLEVLQPEYIVCLGLVAANALLQTTQPVGRLRGVFHKYKTSKVIVTYHPAYLLRNPDAKRAAWDDLQMLMRDMGIDPKARN